MRSVRRRLEPHAAVLTALLVGIVVGILAGRLVATGLSSEILTFGALGVIAVALVSDLAKDAMKRVGRGFWAQLAGRRPGGRRIERAAYGKTKVMAHIGGRDYAPPQWVDPSELDHLGFFFGVARSPTYIPLYGNGFEVLRQIDVRWVADGTGTPPDGGADALIKARIDDLLAENETTGRAFGDGALVRLLRWAPPVHGSPLTLQAEPVGHRRVVAVSSLLREDRSGALRARYEISPRVLDNPMVCGALGVEVAVVTSDHRLVLARRGNASTDYRGQTVVSIGRGMHPELDLGSKSNSARLDPWATVARGVREELGIKVDGTRTRFLALGLELTRMDPDLLGFVDVAYTSDEVKGAFGAGRPKDRWETSDLEFVRFDPPSVADLLSQDRSFTPATAMNLVFALLQSFDERDVQRAFAR